MLFVLTHLHQTTTIFKNDQIGVQVMKVQPFKKDQIVGKFMKFQPFWRFEEISCWTYIIKYLTKLHDPKVLKSILAFNIIILCYDYVLMIINLKKV